MVPLDEKQMFYLLFLFLFKSVWTFSVQCIMLTLFNKQEHSHGT